MIKPDTELIILTSSLEYIYEKTIETQAERFNLGVPLDQLKLDPSITIVINGETLTWALDDEYPERKLTFFKLCYIANSCIACRVSPAQKMQVVQLAKGYGNWITLGVGDGANDVSMIQEAHIGVGIAGKEGT